jgi:hypothetical protein
MLADAREGRAVFASSILLVDDEMSVIARFHARAARRFRVQFCGRVMHR